MYICIPIGLARCRVVYGNFAFWSRGAGKGEAEQGERISGGNDAGGIFNEHLLVGKSKLVPIPFRGAENEDGAF